MNSWYPATAELQANIGLSPLLNVWKVNQIHAGTNLEYSSEIPKPGDFMKITPTFWHYRTPGSLVKFQFDSLYDIKWVSGKVTGDGAFPPQLLNYNLSWQGLPPDINADNNVALIDTINSWQGKIFSSGALEIWSTSSPEYVFQILGRSNGNFEQDYTNLVCDNPDTANLTVPSFTGSQIQDIFTKDSDNKYRYYGDIIRISDKLYYWKSLVDGYIVLTCSYTLHPIITDNPMTLPSDVIARLPELSGHDLTLEKLLGIITTDNNKNDESNTAAFLAALTTIIHNVAPVVNSPIGDIAIGGLEGLIPGLANLNINFSAIAANLNKLIDTIKIVYDKEGIIDLNTTLNLLNKHVSGIAFNHLTPITKAIVDTSESEKELTQVEKDRLALEGANPLNDPKFFDKFFSLLFDSIDAAIANWVKDASYKVDTVVNITKADIGKLYNGISESLTDLADGKIADQDAFEERLRLSGVSVPLLHLAQAVFSFIPTMTMFLGVNLLPIRARLEQASNAKYRTSLNDPNALVQAYYKGSIDYKYLTGELAKYGVSEERIKVMLDAALPLLSPGTIQFAFLRGMITEEQHDKQLSYYGYDNEQIKVIKDLYQQLPQVNDLIRMSVREVFSPDIAEKYGLFEDYPDQLNQYIEKQGLTKEWGERYWGAHWELPSPQMGFEMFHRGIINKPDLKQLLRALDVMPFWREKIIELSYNPITRVDIRRMYQLGVIDRDTVYKSYTNLGYSPNDAELMTEFTVTYEVMHNDPGHINIRTMTQSTIEQAFTLGIITESDALGRLINIGYKGDDARLLVNIAKWQDMIKLRPNFKQEYLNKTATAIKDSYLRQLISRDDALQRLMNLGYNDLQAGQELNLIDYDYSVKFKALMVAHVKQTYIEYSIDKNQAVQKFGAIGVSGTEQSKLFAEMDVLRELRDKKPTYAQFKAALHKGIITQEQFYFELQGLGFADKYVDMLMLLDGEIQ